MKVTVTAIEKLPAFGPDGMDKAKISFTESVIGLRTQLFIYVPWHTREDYPLDSIWDMKVEQV